ncbi:MAG: tetratricopeptide repeat protein [Candidatus Methanoperedens sp.]|nr:tetratricopeptide repeat protein [Candidatus Methanoperedens sp.]
MGKSMVTEKIRISPYLHREITDLVEDGDFASFSDFINIAVSSFLSRNFGMDEDEEEDKPSFELPILLLYLALIDKGVITKEDISSIVEKIQNNKVDNSIIADFISGITDDLVEVDMYNLLDTAKELEKEKSYGSAEQIYKDVIDRFPEDFEPDFNLGCLYLKTGKKEEGRSHLEIALKKAKDMEEDDDIIKMISSEINKIK